MMIRIGPKNSVDTCCISCHSINFNVEVKKLFCLKSKKIKILKDVSGLMRPGLNAIMGPSGSGKTTLINLLAGRLNMTSMEGQVLIEAQSQPDNFKFTTGYVSQDDIIIGTLTVRENLMFSANMRLPKNISQQEKKNKVEEVLYELGLTPCADSKVGTETHRGISGGEKKRTSIGMELIISPKVLFLDEPTTGLDSSTALAVMQLLKTLSLTGRTIIFSIHQPCYNIFKMFDSLLLLTSGRVIYNGPANLTLNYFQHIGYECEKHNNPADFLLDIATNGISCDKKKERANDKSSLSKWLNEEFMHSSQGRNLKLELNKLENIYKLNKSTYKSPQLLFATSFLHQFYFLSVRTCLKISRNPMELLLNSISHGLLGFVIGGIYFQMGNNVESAIQNRTGLIFFLVGAQVFRNISSISLFIEEKVLFRHESTSGFYRVSVYFLTKVLFDIVPMRVVPTVLLCVTSYFMTGLQLKATKFFSSFLSMLLTAVSAASLTFAMCLSSTSISTAHVKTGFCFIFMELFGGFLINIALIPHWLKWLQHISIFKYSLQGLFLNEFMGLQLYSNGTSSDAALKYLQDQNISYGSSWDLWKNHLALFGFTTVYLMITYVLLVVRARSN